jgi:hypothetical protein
MTIDRDELEPTRVADMIAGDRFLWGGELHAVADFRRIAGNNEHVVLSTFEGRTFRAHPGQWLYAECVADRG